jgi:hypothetical protein
MFWRSHHYCCHDCYHPWRSFRRGMVAMLILAFAVIGLLDYPAPGHGHPGHASSSATPVASNEARRHQRPTARHPRRESGAPRPAVRRHAHTDHQHATKHNGDHGKTTARRAAPARPATKHRSSAAGATIATADEGLNWRDFHGIELPVSAAAGPRHSRAGLAWGFADDPGGALIAAVNIAVRTSAEWGPAVFGPMISQQVTGPAKPALLRAGNRTWARLRAASPGKNPPVTQATAVEEAYRFTAYTPTAASVDLVTAGPCSDGIGVDVVTRLRVVWRHGDWRLIAPPGGDWAKVSAQVSSLAGYTIFPAAR